jgi:hypothetical protein
MTRRIFIASRATVEHEGNDSEKAVDIACTRKLRDSVAAAVPHDLDAAYIQVKSVRNLIGGYLAGAVQLDEAVGREAIP